MIFHLEATGSKIFENKEDRHHSDNQNRQEIDQLQKVPTRFLLKDLMIFTEASVPPVSPSAFGTWFYVDKVEVRVKITTNQSIYSKWGNKIA